MTREHSGILFEYESPALVRAKDYAVEIYAIYSKAWRIRALVNGKVTTARESFESRQAAIDYVVKLLNQNYQHKIN